MGRASGPSSQALFYTPYPLLLVTSPLVAELNGTSAVEQSFESPSQRSHQLQPEEPSPEQTMTYNAFCHAIWRTCANHIHQLWQHQSFTFSAQDDQWKYSWIGRTGVPLTEFEQRWTRLVTYPYTGPDYLRAERNPTPMNNEFMPSSSFSQIAGIVSADDTIDAMTDNICHERVKEMARLFRQTSPGDWNRGQEVALGGMLHGYYDFDEFKDKASTIASMVRFRWEMGLLTDYIVDIFELPMPNNQICVMWDRYQWIKRIQASIPNWYERQKKYYNTLRDNGFKLEPLPEQGSPFQRPLSYLSTYLLELRKSEPETLVVLSQVLEFVEKMKQFNVQRVAQNESVRHRGKAWLKSLGRHVRRSLSPRKRIHPTPT